MLTDAYPEVYSGASVVMFVPITKRSSNILTGTSQAPRCATLQLRLRKAQAGTVMKLQSKG